MAASGSEIEVCDRGMPVRGDYTREILRKEVGAVDPPNLGLKRHRSTFTNGEIEMTYPATKHARANSSTDDTVPEGIASGCLSDKVQRRIARFFYESGTDLSMVESFSFHSLADTLASLGKRDTSIPIPSYDLRGFILAEERKEMEVCIKKIQSSWPNTGCSILIDGWRDARERDLINILVDCPKGPVYLRSIDVSAASGSVDAMLLGLNEAVLEVGASNVVQIIYSCTLPCMEDVAAEFMRNHETIYWTASPTNCIGFMLEEIGRMKHTSCILNKARTLTEFVYSSQTILQLVRSHTSVFDLIKDTKVTSTVPFLTLENVVSEKENLKKMLNSSEWISSAWASCREGRRMADLVGDASFWAEANVVLKAAIPLVRALDLIHRDPEPQLGFIYETMDRIKETIREGLENDKASYKPYWSAIDVIWNNCLHSDLHSAAYFLNPRFKYSTNFLADKEVTQGTFNCIYVLETDEKVCKLIIEQLLRYAKSEGAFGRDDAVRLSSIISPVCWWSRYGHECKELQRFAIRILSQTCDGAAKYNLDRSAAEKLLTEGRNVIEQQILEEATHLQYYFQLDSFVKCCRKGKEVEEDINLMNDEVISETQGTPLNSEPTRMEMEGNWRASTSQLSTGECSNSRA